jgi:pSer/pThr/pTyr-binding forkhead associated (FHA) protein
MTVDEEMLLYAFQPGSKVEAYIFHDMLTTEAADANLLDRDMLLEIFSGVKPEKNNEEISEQPVIESAVPIQRKIKLPSVQLTFESGPQQGEQFTVTLPCLIGRRDCDLNLDDGQVSRRHAKLKIVEHKLVIEDLASTNGTQVNGETVTQKRLSPNDLITIGESNLRITPA